jgi:hypothetical protein
VLLEVSGAIHSDTSTTRYVVEKELASGGMGVVYRVFDRVAGENRALKRIRPQAKDTVLYVRAFEREFHFLASLDHPRIIRVFDYGVDEQGAYYTMELLSGHDMRNVAPLPYRDACLQLRDVATSLSLLHARRLLHRDLSPSNVRMTRDGRCKLLDFGAMATFGPCDVVAGTPPVVPPEAFGCGPLDQRADLYSLGALAYFMLTGRHAYPARVFEDLPALWRAPPPPPSALAPDVPSDLDALILRLLHPDPLGRSASAAEVIGQLTAIGELHAEGTSETRRLALSFLSNPRFIGRAQELERAQVIVTAAVRGRGGSILIEAEAGMGRTRLLEEIGMRGQLAGAVVIRVDAGMVRQAGGTASALALRLADAAPGLARKYAAPFRVVLGGLGSDLRTRLGAEALSGATADASASQRGLEEWFGEICLEKPLLVQVDNVERADDDSLGMLAGLARLASDRPLLLVVTECTRQVQSQAIGLSSLRQGATRISLPGLSSLEMLELCRLLFDGAPGVERFAEWLRERTAGSPLHALEISHQLLAKGVIGYANGVWTLPGDVPETELPAALGDALEVRLARLSEPARILAECLSLQRQQPTFELCSLLSEPSEGAGVLTVIDELAEDGVLYPEHEGYRFSSAALQEALLAGMDDARLRHNHRRLGEAFAKLAGDRPRLRIEAGWHLIEGGDEERGADLIAAVTHDGSTVRDLIADLHRLGAALEAALKTYGKYHRSLYERLPLLASLAQAGYYEDRVWGERYGDEALATAEWLTGLRTVRHLRRFLGGWLSLVVGIFAAWVRFRLAPARERKYSFATMLVYLFGTVTTMAGAASLAFDPERCERIAEILEPFSVLPSRLTPVGIYEFCRGMSDVVRESEVAAYECYDTLLTRFQDLRYYPSLPAGARKFYVAGAHMLRGTFGIFRADGRGALESADALDRIGLKLYAMIASQLRCIYFTMRGDLAKAAVHRERVELLSAHVGSVWQVETWEAAALLLVYPKIGDVVASERLAHRLERMGRTVPSLRRYAALARHGTLVAQGERANRPAILRIVAEYEGKRPRSYIGWAGTMGYVARTYNLAGEHAEAKRVCELALSHVTDADRDYILHFVGLDLELALADAALGRPDEALRRIDALVERHAVSGHLLGIGLVHEARASIAWSAGKADEYDQSLREVERCFTATREPGLLARFKRLRELGDPSSAGQKAADVALTVITAQQHAGGAETPVPTTQQLAQTAIGGRRLKRA